MDEILKMNIFFFITSIFVIVLIFIAIIVFIYIRRIFKNIEEMAKIIKNQTSKISKDIDSGRKAIVENGEKIINTVQIVKSFLKKKK